VSALVHVGNFKAHKKPDTGRGRNTAVYRH